MPSRSDADNALFPASELRGKLGTDRQLSKRAAALLRRECDELAVRLLQYAVSKRAGSSGLLEAIDIWEAAMQDPSISWLIEHLASSGQANASLAMHSDLPAFPSLPDAIDAQSEWLPRLVWRNAPAMNAPMQLHAAFHPRDSTDQPPMNRLEQTSQSSLTLPACFYSESGG